jgi:cytidine kinase
MLITFSIIIDDIVFPDGSTRMGVLGGGGPQTAFGMRLVV